MVIFKPFFYKSVIDSLQPSFELGFRLELHRFFNHTLHLDPQIVINLYFQARYGGTSVHQ